MASTTDDVIPKADWDPVAPETKADYPCEHARLRAEAPIAWAENWGGFYTLMRHADVIQASRDPESFTATKMTVIPASPRKGLPRLPLQCDPPQSERYRKGLNLFFKENKVRSWEPALRAMADRLMADLLATDGPADFAGGFAEPFTQGALGILLGLDPEEALVIGRLSHEYVHAVQGEDMPTAGRLSRAVDQFAIDLVADRMKAPRDPETDIVSGLMQYAPEGGPYDETELAGMVRLMLIGGHVVPRNFLCSVAWHMAENPAHLQILRDDPKGEKPMIEELLRCYASNQALVRVATKDTEIGGVNIPQGCPVALNFLSANRDEAVFENAMEFIPDRSPNRHLAFGIGPHMCLGVSMAKLQTRITLDALKSTKFLRVSGEPTWASWTEYGVTALKLDMS
ncbi:MAG: cytochrome P450 [Halocynthiibacter sp.]|jgi:cytochrome P450